MTETTKPVREIGHEPGALARLWAIRYARIPVLICLLFFLFARVAEGYALLRIGLQELANLVNLLVPHKIKR